MERVRRSGRTPLGMNASTTPPIAAALACNSCSVADLGKMETPSAHAVSVLGPVYFLVCIRSPRIRGTAWLNLSTEKQLVSFQ